MTGDNLLERSQKQIVTRYLNWAMKTLCEGKPVSANDACILKTEYQREEDALRQAGVSEETLRSNRQQIIDDADRISAFAGAQIREALALGM